MIDVGGRKLQVVRGGQGGPTVIFESGLGGTISNWDNVRPMVDKFTSTFCYSRAGTAPSDEPAPGRRTPLVLADDLHALLERAGVKPPYVLVGHSLGGMCVRVFAIKHPSEVAGLVLVDTGVERAVVAAQAIDPALAKDILPPLTEADQAKMTPGLLAETEGYIATLKAGSLGISGGLPNVPMVVITSLQTLSRSGPQEDPTTKLKRQLQSDIFQSTTYGMHIVTDRSPHNIMRTEPDLVINAIRFVVDASKAPAPPANPKPVEIVLTDAQSDPILGDYTISATAKITVSREAGHLYMLQSTGGPKLEIGAESETKFFVKSVDATVTFTKGADGKVKSMIFQAGGHSQEVPKAQ
jgi:pimeloyl-ACP methyl ester carboxylesterase